MTSMQPWSTYTSRLTIRFYVTFCVTFCLMIKVGFHSTSSLLICKHSVVTCLLKTITTCKRFLRRLHLYRPFLFTGLLTTVYGTDSPLSPFGAFSSLWSNFLPRSHRPQMSLCPRRERRTGGWTPQSRQRQDVTIRFQVTGKTEIIAWMYR